MNVNRTVSRRRFVAGSLGVLAGGVVGASGAAAGAVGGNGPGPFTGETIDGRQLLIGAIAQPPSGSRIRLEGDASLGSVVVQPGARLWRDEPAALADFQVGDEIVAYGERHGLDFLAERIEPLYQSLTGKVVSVDGDQLETTSGRVLFVSTSVAIETDGSRSAVNAGDFRPGDSITLGGRREQGNDVLIVSRVLR